MDDIVVITLFRHGITEGNKRKAYMGWNDSPLTEEGKEKLKYYQLKKDRYDLFLTSDLERCITTLKLLFPDEEPQRFPDWREMNFGLFQGKTYEELKDRQEYQKWLEDFLHFRPPGGESFEQFSERVQRGWNMLIEQIIALRLSHPFIVTHGGVIRYLLTQLAPEEKEFWDWEIAHGTGIELIFGLEQLRRGERCTLLQAVPLTGRELG